MVTTLQQDIRTSLLKYNELIKFSYGRNLDNALKSAQLEINNYLVCLDPPSYTGGLIDFNETATVALSWLKLDNADSEADEEMNESAIESMETIVKDCHDNSIAWLKIFAEDFATKYTINAYTGLEAFRVKHLMTGFVLQFSISYRTLC